MNIYEYFKEYKKKYYLMKDKLIEIRDAEIDFKTLTGYRFSDMPKANIIKPFDFSDQINRISKLIETYQKRQKEYLELKSKHLEVIDKLDKPIYKTLIKLSFLEMKGNKDISIILSKTYKLNYSIDYTKQLKNKAIKHFERIISKI